MLDFDGIMQVAQELDLPSPPDVDRLTDEIASGAKTEAGVLSTDATQVRARITD